MRGLTPAFQFCARNGSRSMICSSKRCAELPISGSSCQTRLEAALSDFTAQPRRIGIGEVGQHQHRRRMLEEAVRHFLQRQPHVLEADFLADRVERHVREAVVHGAHHARQHRAVADAGVEHAHRRRTRMQMRKLFGDAVRHLPFLAAGIDEQQIFLPVVEEAEIALRIARLRRRRAAVVCRAVAAAERR